MRYLAVLMFLCISCRLQAAEERLACIADTNLSSYEGERDFNYGVSSRLRLKGIQMMALMRFNLKPVAGWKVNKATLYLRYAGGDRKLKTLGFSTIGSNWEEGTGSGQVVPRQVCFRWREHGATPWAGPDTDLTDVTFTAGKTIASYADIVDKGDGWFAVEVEPKLVQAMLAGVSYGLVVTDEKGQTMSNNDVYSREQNNSAPYLIVSGGPAPALSPQAVTALQAAPELRAATFANGALRLSFTGSPNAFAYEVTYIVPGMAETQTVPRYRIPLAIPGQRQTILISGLPPSARLSDIKVTPISLTGQRGTVAFLPNAMASPGKFRPEPLPRADMPVVDNGKQITNTAASRLRILAYPDTDKAHPVSGNLLEAVGREKYAGSPVETGRHANAVWDGRAITLHAARSEIVAFHLLIESDAPVSGLQIQPPDVLKSVDGKQLLRPAFSLFRDWYVKDGDWFPEVCVPVQGPLAIPTMDNAVPGQRNQSVLVELLIPRQTGPGLYRGSLIVVAIGQAPKTIPLEITVNNLTLPDTLSFDVSLNAYGTVGGGFGLNDNTPEYRAVEKEYHRLAHAHRTTFAPLGYTQNGSIVTNYAPPLEGKGAQMKVQSWASWDTQFGALLDGSAFDGLPRGRVPITHLYLPFHESWPEPIQANYRYQQTTQAFPALIVEHAMKAPPIEQAFPAEYGQAMSKVISEFAKHFAEKGWTKTEYQFYLNNKNNFKNLAQGGRGSSWWLLDEPNYRDDWLALAYYARLLRAGQKDFPRVPIAHREDISRPQWQRDYLDGLVDVMVTAGELYSKGPLLRELRDTLGVRYWNYGSANPVRDSNLTQEAWAVRARLAGADAIVPWQTVGSDANFTRAEETALLLPGKRFGIAGPVASLRLKALRRGQQDAEYLVLLGKQKGWDREQVTASIEKLLNLSATFEQTYADDAGRYSFSRLRSADFEAMRRAIGGTVGLSGISIQ